MGTVGVGLVVVVVVGIPVDEAERREVGLGLQFRRDKSFLVAVGFPCSAGLFGRGVEDGGCGEEFEDHLGSQDQLALVRGIWIYI